MMLLASALTVAFLVERTYSYPNNVGCDFKVIPGKASTGLNVMTTTGNIMGSPPSNSNTLASASAAQFSAGSTVTITFSNTFSMGFVHSTAGTFTAPEFTSTANTGAAPCTGSDSILYKGTFGPTNSIAWTAPNDVSALTAVTLSFAGAGGYGPISRRSITLTKSVAAGPSTSSPVTGSPTASPVTPTASPVTGSPTGAPTINGYRRINNGTCGTHGMLAIRDVASCEAAARGLQLSDVTATVTTDTPRPEACYYVGNQLYLPTNPANVGKGAVAGYELLCLVPAQASTAPPTTELTTPYPVVVVPPSTSVNSVGANQYRRFATGTCSSNGMDKIVDPAICAGAAAALRLPLQSDELVMTSQTPAPEACFFLMGTLYYSTNPANSGYGANDPYEIVCVQGAQVEAAAVAPKEGTNMMIIGGAIGGGTLVLCFCAIFVYRRRGANETQKFEV